MPVRLRPSAFFNAKIYPFGVEPPVLTSRKTILNCFARQSGHRQIKSSIYGGFLFVYWSGVESANCRFGEFADGRSITSPDNENTEQTKPQVLKRGYSSVEQTQDLPHAKQYLIVLFGRVSIGIF